MSRTFFFQQQDTKISDFDVKGILILEPFFWGNVIFKIFEICSYLAETAKLALSPQSSQSGNYRAVVALSIQSASS